MKKSGERSGQSAAELISKRIAELGDWRGETLSRMRKLIKEAEPNAVEEWKWMGTPIWSLDGIITTGESYKQVVKLTFAKGAFLKDPTQLFNSSLEGNLRRAIDIREGEVIDAAAFKALVRDAVALNKSKPSKASKPPARSALKSVKASAKNASKSGKATVKSAPKAVKVPLKTVKKAAKASSKPSSKPAKASSKPAKASSKAAKA